MLSRLIAAFLPRSKHLLNSWLQLPNAVILETKKINSVTVSIASSSICHEVMGPERAKGFGIVNKAEIDIFMKLYCLFHEPGDVGNFISGSSAFSKIKLKFNLKTLSYLN